MTVRCAFTAILFLLGFEASSRADNEMKIFGHTVEVAGPFNDQKLVVDGKVLVKDAIVSIDRIEVVGGTGILIGGSSGGGNVCDSAPFIVSFLAGAPPKTDGPIEECGMGKIMVHAQDIEIIYVALPNAPGHRWVWTLPSGFKDAGPLAFQADSRLGWDALRRDEPLFPIDLYKNSDVGAAIKALTGPDDQTFSTGLTVSSKGEFVGDTYFGTGCMAHNCPFAGSFVIVDTASQKAFVAWKEDDKPFVVRPPVKDWPGPFRARLKEWTQKFK